MCGIDLVGLCIFAVIALAIYYILQIVPFFAPFKQIINILFAALVTIFILVRVLVPLFHCAGV